MTGPGQIPPNLSPAYSDTSSTLLESKLHINYLELKEFQDLCQNNIVLIATCNTTVVSYIYKEAGMQLGPLCALLWRILTWCTNKQVSLNALHIPGLLNMAADNLSRGLPGNRQQVAPTSNRPLCDKVQQQTSPVCVTTARPQAWAINAQDLDPYAFPPAVILGKVLQKLQDYPCNHPDCSRVAQHTLVLVSSGHVQPNPTEPAQPVLPAHSAIQSNSSQESVKPESACMAPRASAIKEQDFSEAVAARINAPQRGSTRSVYEAKWTTFTGIKKGAT